MGWETRGNRQYYYRKARIGGRVRSEYVGSGDFAQFSAALDDEKREEAARQRELDRRARSPPSSAGLRYAISPQAPVRRPGRTVVRPGA